jgi:hypothetical protein
MEYIIGLISGLVFFICLGLSFYFGYKAGSKKQPITPINQDTDEQTIQRTKQLHEDFQAIMNYDLSTAMQRKKVI